MKEGNTVSNPTPEYLLLDWSDDCEHWQIAAQGDIAKCRKCRDRMIGKGCAPNHLMLVAVATFGTLLQRVEEQAVQIQELKTLVGIKQWHLDTWSNAAAIRKSILEGFASFPTTKECSQGCSMAKAELKREGEREEPPHE